MPNLQELPKRKPQSWMNVPRALVVAFATLHGAVEAKAIDIPPGTEWVKGLELMEKAIRNRESVETTGIIPLDSEEQKDRWVYSMEGSSDHVRVFWNDVIKKFKEHNVDASAICFLHGHTDPSPLSPGDVQALHKAREQGIKGEIPWKQVYIGVVDRYGVWYARPFRNGEERKKHFPNLDMSKSEQWLTHVVTSWLELSKTPGMTAEKLLSNPLYKDLRDVYAMFGAYMRYVPLAQAKKERPCAGLE